MNKSLKTLIAVAIAATGIGIFLYVFFVFSNQKTTIEKQFNPPRQEKRIVGQEEIEYAVPVVNDDDNFKTFLRDNFDNFSFKNTTKENFLSEIEDKVLFVRITRAGCDPCDHTETRSQQYMSQLSNRNEVVSLLIFTPGPNLGVDRNNEYMVSNGVVSDFIERNNISEPMIVDEQSLSSQHMMEVIAHPYTFVVDKEGIVVSENLGPPSETTITLLDNLTK